MAIEIPSDMTPELVPFAWLLGQWEGVGVLGYGQDVPDRQFGQIVSFTQSGLPFIEYRAESYLLNEEGRRTRPISVETGFWQLGRKLQDGDLGPGLIPGAAEPTLATAADVEKLRREEGGFEITANINHPGGVSELYVGVIDGPRIQMATDAVMRAEGAKEYTAASRMYGLVNGELMWAWDMAALGHEMASHASARLRRTDAAEVVR